MLIAPIVATNISSFTAGASRERVVDVLRSMRRTRFAQSRPWLAAGNPYRSAAVDKQLDKNIDLAALEKYITVSAILHMTDGWGYLSDAFRALAAGQRETAIHLAYYAELRAAISILACEGIGVFNRRHFALQLKRPPQALGGSTHPLTWNLLQAWSAQPGRVDGVLDAIVVDSKTVREWLREVKPSFVSAGQAVKDWLRAWSVDLEESKVDQYVRNETSYRPWKIRAPNPPGPSPKMHLVDPVTYAWDVLQPGTNSASAALDSHLLRLALQSVVPDAQTLAAALQPTSASAQLKGFLASPASELHSVFSFAERRLNIDDLDPNPIISRAILLLRLSAAFVRRLLDDAGVTVGDLAVWSQPYGDHLGLWDSAGAPSPFADLWADVQDGLDEVRDGPTSHVSDVCRSIGSRPVLTQFTRVPLWLLPA